MIRMLSQYDRSSFFRLPGLKPNLQCKEFILPVQNIHKYTKWSTWQSQGICDEQQDHYL